MSEQTAVVEAPPARASVVANQALVWTASLIPVVLATIVLVTGSLQDGDAPPRNLAGQWLVHEGAEPGLEQPALDDRGWRMQELPGRYSASGFRGEDAWFRKRFNVPAVLVEQNSVFVIGSTTSGTFDVFLNGRHLGHGQIVPRGTKQEHLGPELFRIPAGILRPVDNVLALKVHWELAGLDGIVGELLLGTEAGLGASMLQAANIRRSIYAGALGALLILSLLIAFVLAADWASEQRNHYVATLLVVGAGTAHVLLSVLPAIAVRYMYPSGMVTSLAFLAALGLFTSHHLTGGSRRAARVLAAADFVVALIALALIAFRKSPPSMVVHTGIGPFFVVVSCAVLSVVGVYLVSLGRRALDRLAGIGVLWAVGTGLLDATRDLGITTGTHVFIVVGVPATALLAVVVVFGDFANVAFSNKRLTVTLGKTNTELQVTLLDLQTALDRAQEASRLKSEFVATVSHELRTPLNSIINVPEGLLERFALLRLATCGTCSAVFELEEREAIIDTPACPACAAQGPLRESQAWRFRGDLGMVAENLGRVTRAGRGLLSLINDVLDFSKLEAGKMELHLSEARMSQIIPDVVELLQPVAAKSSVAVRVHNDAGDTSLSLDQVKVSQVLINLLGNAIKFSPVGAEVLLECRINGDRCRLSVHDHGIGIAPEHHHTIFESFRQVDGGSTRKFGGTGLGLAITRKYVELHGGSMRVESTVGRGSIFHVELPAHPHTAVTAASHPTPLQEDGLEITALIVDDEPFAIENLKLTLAPVGCRVVGIRDPRALDAALAELRPDILFVDVVMPHLSGLDVLRELQKRPNIPPIVVTSAHPGNEQIVRALGAEWLEKPWRPSTAQALVVRLCKDRGCA